LRDIELVKEANEVRKLDEGVTTFLSLCILSMA